jgi:hypothetical protein
MPDRHILTRAELAEQQRRCQAGMLAIISETGNPHAALAVLYELTGAMSAVVSREGAGRAGEVVAMADALHERVTRDAAGAFPGPGEPRH